MTKIIISLSSRRGDTPEVRKAVKAHGKMIKAQFEDYAKQLSDKLSVPATFRVLPMGTIHPSYDVLVSANFGNKQVVLIQATYSSDVKDKSLKTAKITSDSKISVKNSEFSRKFSIFCTKAIGKTAVTVPDFVKVLKAFAKLSEGAKIEAPKPKTKMQSDFDARMKAAKSLVKQLKTAGLDNVFVERYAMAGFGISAVYRPGGKSTSPGYEVKKDGENFVVSLCIGPYSPPTAEFTRKLKTVKSIEAVVQYLENK